jgi:putative inorganic carbon (HCO3(-)) transporter
VHQAGQMRDIFLVLAVLVGLGFTIKRPFIGVLLWEWFSIMAPHQEAFGFSRTLPLNLLIAVVTLLSWFFSSEPKRIAPHKIILLLAIFLMWMTFNSFFAFRPDYSWPHWDRTWRIFAFGFVVSALATNRVRIEALLWCAAISLMYYGVKGGIFTLMTGGSYRVYGPSGTIIGDNNQLALALLMIIPLIEYLRSTASSKWLSRLLLASMAFIGISVLGSYSRGAMVAMGVLVVLVIAQSRRKVLYTLMLLGFAVIALSLMPPEFFDRASSIKAADSDSSFLGRWMAWQVAFFYATDHLPFGAGFYAPQLAGIFNHYFPGAFLHAAHSIYFQVLGEHGFIGLVLYLLIMISGLLSYRRLSKLNLQNTDAAWIRQFARMCGTSLLMFALGGALLSMAYYDIFIMLLCLVPPVNAIASARGKRTANNRATAGMGPP